MKKKLLITAISLSVLLLIGTSIQIFANNDGYELYKQAMKNTHKIKNASVNIDTSMKDNSIQIKKVEMDAEFNLKDKLGKSNVIIETGNKSMDLNIFYQDHDFIIKNDAINNYYVLQGNELSEEERQEQFNAHHNPELLSLMEKVFDTLTLPTHDDFIVTDQNGTQSITVDLTSDEIPGVIHEGSQYMIKKMLQSHENAKMSAADYPFLSDDLNIEMPVLVDEIQLESIKIEADLTEDKLIDNQMVYVKVSGNDKNGKQHLLEYELNMDYSKINKTTIQPIEIDLAEAITLEKSLFNHGYKFH